MKANVLRARDVMTVDREARGRVLIAGSVALLGVAMLLSLSVGPTGITLASLPRVLVALFTGSDDPAAAREYLVLVDLRLPRTLLGAFVGASLAIAGAMMQGLFRNPLADPGLIGVSSGAALAAVATIALGNTFAAPWVKLLGVYALPFAAFFGGLAATLVLVSVAGRHGQLMVGTLLLAGIAVAAFASALTGLLSYTSDDRELRDLTLWSMGSLSGASWPKVIATLPFAAAVALAVPRLVRGLNGFLLGEAEAFTWASMWRRRSGSPSPSRPPPSVPPSPSPVSSGLSASSFLMSSASSPDRTTGSCFRPARCSVPCWCSSRMWQPA
jgi:iron complex transport system permease protein